MHRSINELTNSIIQVLEKENSTLSSEDRLLLEKALAVLQNKEVSSSNEDSKVPSIKEVLEIITLLTKIFESL